MRNGSYALVLASIVAQAAAGCDSDDGGARNTAGGGGQGGDSTSRAGASGTTTDDTEGGAAGEAGGSPGNAAGTGGNAAGSGGDAVGTGGVTGGSPGDAAGRGGDAAGSGGDTGGSPGDAAGSGGNAAGTGGNAAGTGGVAGAAGSAGSANGGATDSGYDRTLCPPCERGCAAGDPHLITLDGAYYDFQAPGEYALVASSALVVQARLEAKAACENTAQVTAVAFGSGTNKISVHADAARFVRLGNGSSLSLDEADTQFGDWQLESACDGLVASSAAGDQVIVHFVGETWLDVEVRPASTDSTFGGLLGNFDGDPTNDIALPGGTLLPTPVPWEGLYSAFGGAYMVTEETSLFVYDSGESAATYAGGTIPGVVDLSTFPAATLGAAATACTGVDPSLMQSCMTDVICAGVDAEVAAAWFVTNPEPTVVLEVQEPTGSNTCLVPGAQILAQEDNTLECPAGCGAFAIASPQTEFIWGTDVYTADSPVCIAAVHAGVIDDDVGGIVVVDPASDQVSYTGSTQNGVTSSSFPYPYAGFFVSAP